MLVHGVHGDGKQAAAAPFEGLLLAVVVPHRSRAPAGEDVGHLLVQVALRRGLAARRNLDHVGVVNPARALQVDERALAALAFPTAELQLLEIPNVEAADNRRALTL